MPKAVQGLVQVPGSGSEAGLQSGCAMHALRQFPATDLQMLTVLLGDQDHAAVAAEMTVDVAEHKGWAQLPGSAEPDVEAASWLWERLGVPPGTFQVCHTLRQIPPGHSHQLHHHPASSCAS